MPRSTRHPQLPTGTEVAAYRTHEEAAAAVEKLAENQFPLASVTIVGSNLHLVERVLERLTPARVARAGATQGLTWGLLMALFSILFYPQAATVIPVVLIVVGVLIGMLFTMLSWAVSRHRGTYAAESSLVASRYAVLVSEMPDKAFALLTGTPGNLAATPRRPVRRDFTQAVPSPVLVHENREEWNRVAENPALDAEKYRSDKPSEYGSRPDEKPRFGVRVSEEERARLRQEPEEKRDQAPSGDASH